MAVLEDLREKTAELLDEGLNTGSLSSAEHSWRRGHLAQAETVEALEALVEDLLVPAGRGSTALSQRGASQVTLLGSRTFALADLGRRSELVTLLGSSKIDLRGISPSEELTMELVAVMGDVVVEVPSGVTVRVECTPVLGDVHIAPLVQSSDAVIRITGVVVMGSLRVVQARPHAR